MCYNIFWFSFEDFSKTKSPFDFGSRTKGREDVQKSSPPIFCCRYFVVADHQPSWCIFFESPSWTQQMYPESHIQGSKGREQ